MITINASHKDKVEKILLTAIDRDFPYVGLAIGEGLPNTAGHFARWITQLALEARPDLRVDDKGFRYMARPIACKE